MRRYTGLALLLLFSCFVLALWTEGSMWVLISILGAVVILVPSFLNRDINATYHSKLMKVAYIPLILYLALSAFQLYQPFQAHRIISLYLQSVALMVFGYMVMLNIDINTETLLSKRWMLLLSIAFTLAFTLIHTFFQYRYMMVTGYLVTNEDFLGGVSPTPSNRVLMAPMLMGSVATIFNAVLLRRHLQAVPKSELTQYYGGGKLD